MGIFDGGRKLKAASAQVDALTMQIQTLQGQVASLQEDISVTYDPDANLSATGGGSLYFRRLSTTNRDLKPMQHERMLEIAYYLADFNPLARRVLELTRDFVVGEGVTVVSQAKDEAEKRAQQDVIDRFWTDPVNRWDLKLPDKVFELALAGNQCWPVVPNPISGHVRLGYIDPAEITAVITAPNDATQAAAVECRKPGATTEKRYFRVVHVDEDPQSPTFGRLIGPREGETLRKGDEQVPYEGSCFFFAINKVSNATLGRSDLLPLADWIDAHDQVLFGEVDRLILMKSFIWDITFDGMSEEAIEERLKKMGAPKPGTVRGHNDKVHWEAVTPDLKQADAKIGADMLLSEVAMGAGVPKTWIAGTMDVNRATAAELGEPAFKRLTARQKYIRYMIELIVTYVLDQAEAAAIPNVARTMNGVYPEPWPIAVQAPEMRSKDLKTSADTLMAAATALQGLIAGNLLDEETGQELVATLVEQFGIDINLEEMRARIEKASQDAALAPYNAPANGNGMLTVVNGNGKGGVGGGSN